MSKSEIINKAAMLEYMHFQSRPRKCQYCEDLKQNLCQGNVFKDVTECMLSKAKNGEVEIYTNMKF